MLFIVRDPIQKTTKTGKPYALATLIDEMGIAHEKVSIWSDHPDFGKSEVRGSIKSGEKGKSLSKEITYSAGTTRPPESTYIYDNQPKRWTQIDPINTTKESSFENTQRMKELGIKTSSTIGLAVELANAELVQPFTPVDKLEAIKKWRKVLWEEWDYKETKSTPIPPPVDGIDPADIPF